MSHKLAKRLSSSRSAISLFSGCGGFCEGMERAGFDVRAAVELDRYAAQTYRTISQTSLCLTMTFATS